MTTPVLDEMLADNTETPVPPPATLLAEMKQPEEVVVTQKAETATSKQQDPAQDTPPKPRKTEIRYYRDSDFTDQILPTDGIKVGTIIYTRVAFPKNVPIVFADDQRARPWISTKLSNSNRNYRYFRMKPRSVAYRDLLSGDARPYRKSKHIFICKFVVQAEDFGTTFRVWERYPGDNETVEGDILTFHPPFFLNPGESAEFTYVEGPKRHPSDFVGQVVALPPEERHPRSRAHPLPSARVTILSGPLSGTHVFTDTNGYYLFPKVAENTLHLRVEKQCFEPKDVIVHRERPTTLPDGFSLDFRHRDPQRHPGVILLGLEWPDIVRQVLRETTVAPDLLFVVAPISRKHSQGIYHDGVVIVEKDGGGLRGLLSTRFFTPIRARTGASRIGKTPLKANLLPQRGEKITMRLVNSNSISSRTCSLS